MGSETASSKVDHVLRYILRYFVPGWYGKVELSVEDGKVTHVRTTQVKMARDL